MEALGGIPGASDIIVFKVPDFTTEVISVLHVDRTPPCGNSEGADNRGRLHVKVSNLPAEPIPVTLTEDVGVEFFAEAETVTTPGTEQTLISVVVPLLTTRQLKQLIVACRMNTRFRIFAGSTLVGSGRTGPGESNGKFSWSPSRSVPAGTTITVKLLQMFGQPASDVEAYLQASDLT